MTTGSSTITREHNTDEKEAFERAIKLLESQLANVGAHLAIDSATRIAYSKEIKTMSTSLNHLVAGHTALVHGAQVDFSRLTQSKKNAVYASIVASAGRSNQKVSTAMARLSFAGRGLLVISVGISAYNVAMSNNKLASAGQELASTGASISGGLAGGALAGLACGPAAPVCVTICAFVGGAVAAFGVRLFW